MIKKKKLIIGPRNSGKTTLAYYFEEKNESVRKQAHIVYGKESIDTPSPYLERPWMRQHLISLQKSAYIVFLLFPLKVTKKSYPPGFTHVFKIPVVGVVTYTYDDMIDDNLKQMILKKMQVVGTFTDVIFVNITDKNQIEEQFKNY